MRVGRWRHLALPLNDDEVWILGGDDSSQYPMITTEIYQNGAFRDGPDMPESASVFCGVQVNASHLFIGEYCITSSSHICNLNKTKNL